VLTATETEQYSLFGFKFSIPQSAASQRTKYVLQLYDANGQLFNTR